MIIENEYMCIKTLIIESDYKSSYNVYAKHRYKDISINFKTDTEDFVKILKEVNDIFKKLNRLGERYKDDNNSKR